MMSPNRTLRPTLLALALSGLMLLPATQAQADDLPTPPWLEERLDAWGPAPHTLPEGAPEPGAPAAWSPDPGQVSSGQLELSVENAVFMALQNNRSLAMEQLQPLITGTFEAVERAVFDPVLFAEMSLSEDETVRQFDQAQIPDQVTRSQRDRAEAGLRQSLPTGTDIELSLRTVRSESTRTDEQFTSRAGLTLTQALLRGARIDSNLASLRQARVDTQSSLYEFRGFTESLVADVETAYWDYVLASRRTQIFEESLAVASQQLEETRQRIRVGDRPESEEISARAEEALRRQGLIDARSQRAQTRIRLLQLINPSVAHWGTQVTPLDAPDPQVPALEPVGDHMQLARELRPALNEARLRVQRGELELIRTRQGLLPRLDLFVTLGQSGYASAFGDAWREVDGPGYDYSVGLQLEYPIGNRAARADAERAGLSRQQALEALGNLQQLTALDVQNAWFEANRTREQIQATQLTRELQEEVLRGEQARFRVGTGTALALSQAQRDLLESQLEEAEAIIRHRQALTELYRQSGTLLLRRGIEAPGDQAVEVSF
ncbi:TolC family protein [Ectothiorhodospira variabilis]|uniref:TolC family protein n=1 Tax=Ectothiorhodospira variabilis TaxID=505694 RepID=UPI001EFC163C|nr:TolC family protein [Ectothiorhodospira variabilis]MCG5494883.1 TolC family protein [Ectothiorhodospira variabilis]MCG5497712.1 TolC family protein [Ectothiorhodospira variabilis]MCG5504396.1 TolC family protein [Ectothiorhodospira variabilis]MCG5507551.1 TolC family protein [Ectothiorhodospira variabilis]